MKKHKKNNTEEQKKNVLEELNPETPEQEKMDREKQEQKLSSEGSIEVQWKEGKGNPKDKSKEIEAAEQERDRYKDKYLRLMAEFDNYKKRTQSEISQVIRSANEKLILELLEVVDNFQRALEAKSNTEDFSSFKKGIDLIFQKLFSVLRNNGLEPFDAVGEMFDPELHDAMLQVNSEDVPENHIAQEIDKGYRLNQKVIRHTKVIVSKGKQDIEESSENMAHTSENETPVE